MTAQTAATETEKRMRKDRCNHSANMIAKVQVVAVCTSLVAWAHSGRVDFTLDLFAPTSFIFRHASILSLQLSQQHVRTSGYFRVTEGSADSSKSSAP